MKKRYIKPKSEKIYFNYSVIAAASDDVEGGVDIGDFDEGDPIYADGEIEDDWDD